MGDRLKERRDLGNGPPEPHLRRFWSGHEERIADAALTYSTVSNVPVRGYHISLFEATP